MLKYVMIPFSEIIEKRIERIYRIKHFHIEFTWHIQYIFFYHDNSMGNKFSLKHSDDQFIKIW